MKLEKVREEINYFSQKTSEASQKLALAGIAIIWLFKSTSGGINSFHWLLYWSLVFLILTIIIEFIHYLIFAPIWALHYCKNHKKLMKDGVADIEDKEVEQPTVKNIVGWVLFALKAIALIVGYVFLAAYMWDVVKIAA